MNLVFIIFRPLLQIINVDRSIHLKIVNCFAYNPPPSNNPQPVFVAFPVL